jgi:hypothetical protein
LNGHALEDEADDTGDHAAYVAHNWAKNRVMVRRRNLSGKSTRILPFFVPRRDPETY